MPSSVRLRRRLLREVVADNLAFVQGTALPLRRRVGTGAIALFLGCAAVVAFAIGLAGTARLGVLALPAGRVAGLAAPVSGPPGQPRPITEALPARSSGSGSAGSGSADGASNLGQVGASNLGQVAAAAGAVQLAFPSPRPLDARALPLAVRRIVVDPGHGGAEQGTVAAAGDGAIPIEEKAVTLDIATRLRDLLAADSYEVLLTRESDADLSLDERARLANAFGGDIFVSVHVNSIPDRRSRGVETYVLGPTDDPVLTRLAARENLDSGYSLADLKGLVEGIYADVRRGESRRLAESVQGQLFAALHGLDPEVRDWGVKAAPFVVLVTTDMPAILAEVACLSNAAEARRLADPTYRQTIAAALAAGIRAYSESAGVVAAGG